MSAVQIAIEHWPHVAPLLTAPEDEEGYDRLVRALDHLLDLVGDDEEHPLASLASRIGDLIEAYDGRHRPMPEGTGVEVLRSLMQEHGLAQTSLPELGTQSVVSEILSGRRRLNLRQIAALADRFGLPEAVFIDRARREPKVATRSSAAVSRSAGSEWKRKPA